MYDHSKINHAIYMQKESHLNCPQDLWEAGVRELEKQGFTISPKILTETLFIKEKKSDLDISIERWSNDIENGMGRDELEFKIIELKTDQYNLISKLSDCLALLENKNPGPIAKDTITESRELISKLYPSLNVKKGQSND